MYRRLYNIFSVTFLNPFSFLYFIKYVEEFLWNTILRAIEMFYLNTTEQLFLFQQLDQLEVCPPYSRLLTGIPLLAVIQNLRWNSNKTSLHSTKSISLPSEMALMYNLLNFCMHFPKGKEFFQFFLIVTSFMNCTV